MKRALTRLAWAVLLAASSVIPTGLSRARAVAAEPGQEADADNVWTLVYTVATKPEGVVVNLTPDGRSTMRMINSFTAVKDVRIGADGTFKFEGCDFGFFHGDTFMKRADGEVHVVSNGQPLFRGSGKWQPAGPGVEESLTLRLEYCFGSGTQTTTAPWYKGTHVERISNSPDGRTITIASQGPGAATSLSYAAVYGVSDWTLRPAAGEPASGKECAAGDECQDEKQLQAKGPVVTCVNSPGVGTVKAKKKKKEADLAVFVLGPVRWHEPPGSSGTFQVEVSNAGPCDATGDLAIYVEIGAGKSPEYPVGGSLSVTSSGPNQSGQSGWGMDIVELHYVLSLPKGTSQMVQVKGHDTTPPNQKYPYCLYLEANIKGYIPDPDESNNYDHRIIHVDLPPGAPGSANGPGK